jgi:hypothetical protein
MARSAPIASAVLSVSWSPIETTTRLLRFPLQGYKGLGRGQNTEDIGLPNGADLVDRDQCARDRWI